MTNEHFEDFHFHIFEAEMVHRNYKELQGAAFIYSQFHSLHTETLTSK